MLLRVLAGFLILVGGTMAGGLASVAGNGKHAVGAIIGAALFSVVAPIGAGIWLWRAARRRERALAASGDRAETVRLLKLARAHGGHLTAAEVMVEMGLELGRAEQLLDGLCKHGLAEHRVAEDGTIVYRIRPLLGARDKERARGVLERD